MGLVMAMFGEECGSLSLGCVCLFCGMVWVLMEIRRERQSDHGEVDEGEV